MRPEGPGFTGAAAPSAPLFRALGDPTRRRALEMLVAEPLAVGEVARRLGAPRSLAGHHLRVLARAGLVRLKGGEAAVRPEALRELRAYVDRALTAAAVTSAWRGFGPVAE